MTTITVRAHFDGEKLILREPLTLPPHTDLLITLHTLPDSEQDDWRELAVQGLSAAYGDNEPDYPTSLILWDEQFARSQPQLIAAAQEAQQEVEAGKARPMDFDRL